MDCCCTLFLTFLVLDVVALGVSLVGVLFGFVKDDVMFVLKWWGVANGIFVAFLVFIVVCCAMTCCCVSLTRTLCDKLGQYRETRRERQRRHATHTNTSCYGTYAKPSNYSRDWQDTNLNTPRATYSDNERKQLHHENAYVRVENETRNIVGDKTAVSKDEPTKVSLDLHGHSLKKAIQKVKKIISEEPKGTIVEIITGRGIHSEDGKPVIKPAVEKLLTSKDYEQTWASKGGMVTFTL